AVRHEVRELVWGPPVAMAQDFEAAAKLPLVREERRRAAEILGFEPELETAPGGTDATFMIHEAKIPTIVELGPAGALSHDVHEYVEAESGGHEVTDGERAALQRNLTSTLGYQHAVAALAHFLGCGATAEEVRAFRDLECAHFADYAKRLHSDINLEMALIDVGLGSADL